MREVPIPNKLVIAEDYEYLLEELKEFLAGKKRIAILSGNFAQKILAERLTKDLGLEIVEDKEAELIIGIGGGKVLDKAKFKAKQLDKEFVSIPTLVSHDGICSPVAVVDGKSQGAVMPVAMFVPLYLIESSPAEQIQAGVGDLISNLSAIEDWKLACAAKKAEMDDFAVMLARRAAMNVIKSLEQMQDATSLKEKNFLKSLIESLALSGIAMSIAGNSRPCSGAEHMISHAIDELFGAGVKASHGVQVLIATLYLEKLRGYDLLDNANNPKSHKIKAKLEVDSRLTKILSKLKFPTQFSDIGLSKQDLDKVLELAPKTRPDRFSILTKQSYCQQAL